MTVYLIRHGATRGNRQKRYVGVTDEPLLEASAAWLKSCKAPRVNRVYVSPMRRCKETAALLYPYCRPEIVEDFRECDFGAFEYRNYQELQGNPDYQRFIDTMGASGFPGGENIGAFRRRCVKAWEQVMSGELQREEAGDGGNFALVVHGGTLMSILEQYGRPAREYYGWQAENGRGYVMDFVPAGSADKNLQEGCLVYRRDFTEGGS